MTKGISQKWLRRHAAHSLPNIDRKQATKDVERGKLSHFSADWVLLRDAARTLMKATLLIRSGGIGARVESPGRHAVRL